MNTANCLGMGKRMKKPYIFTIRNVVVMALVIVDIISVVLTVQYFWGGGHGVFVVYFILQALVSTMLLVFYFLHVKPLLGRLTQACTDFENGKTLELEIRPDDLKWSPLLGDLVRKLNEVISRKDRLLLSHKEAEYLALQNQINPHFLYNTLEAIRGDALRARLFSLAGTAEALASFFRYTISGENLLSTVDDELLNIHNYFLIQRYRFGNNLKLEIVFIENEEGIRKLLIPKLTLQPIVENCVFHGLETKENKGTIRISFDQTQKFLFISVKDDGIGMPAKELQRLNDSLIESPFRVEREEEMGRQHTGIALKNVSQRIKLLFGKEYGITVYSSPDVGTNVKIILPGQATAVMPDNKRGI